jgi:hypothetical protein
VIVPVAEVTTPASSARTAFTRRLARGLDAVSRGQHPSGEILSFRRDPLGNYTYVRSPFVSTFVHDTLACFDPTSPGWLDGSLELLPERSQGRFVRTVVELRQRIRSFLIWQQEATGHWRFFGRGSGIDPDVNSTACASVALLEGHGVRSLTRWELQQALILSFRSAEGPFFTFLKPRRGGYGWLSDEGVPVVGFDRVVNAEVLRYLHRVGSGATPEATRLTDWLLDEANGPGARNGSPLYPNPIAFAYVLSRALEGPDVPARQSLNEALLLLALRLQQPDGGFGGALSTAMGATALLALGNRGAELAAARLAVLRARGPGDSWPYEDFVVHGFGAPAWTTALSMAFLVRHHCATGEAPA